MRTTREQPCGLTGNILSQRSERNTKSRVTNTCRLNRSGSESQNPPATVVCEAQPARSELQDSASPLQILKRRRRGLLSITPLLWVSDRWIRGLLSWTLAQSDSRASVEDTLFHSRRRRKRRGRALKRPAVCRLLYSMLRLPRRFCALSGVTAGARATLHLPATLCGHFPGHIIYLGDE